MSSPPTSPACRISSTPASAVCTSGRTRPCVSEISPTTCSLTHALVRFTAAPPRDQRVGDVEMIEHARDDEVDELVDAASDDDRSPGAAGMHDGARRASRAACSRGGSRCSGVSRGTRISVRRSLSATSAARSTSERDVPAAIARQRAHRARADHHAGVARRSGRRRRAAIGVVEQASRSDPTPQRRRASRSASTRSMSVSVSQQPQAVRRDDQLHAAAPRRASASSSRTAYGAPDAPVIAMTIGRSRSPDRPDRRVEPRRDAAAAPRARTRRTRC